MAVLKGAFIRLDVELIGAPVVVVFQFNPTTLSRSRSSSSKVADKSAGTLSDALAAPADPSESITFELFIDATDQLAAGNPIAAASGILPTISALEMLMVPKESLAADLFSLSGGAAPYQNPEKTLPTVLFFWGAFRIVPVKITSLSINETLFDTRLNPVQAKVSVSIEILTTDKLEKEQKFARDAYDYTQGVREVMAALNTLNAVEIGVSSALSLSI